MDKRFIVNRQGKEFVLYAGLLDAAHKAGLKRLATELLHMPSAENNHTAVCKALVELEDGRIFTGIGDANPDNVGRMIAMHCIRMAETRAKARALRDALNSGGEAAFEELGGEEDQPERPAPTRHAQAPPLQLNSRQVDANGEVHARPPARELKDSDPLPDAWRRKLQDKANILYGLNDTEDVSVPKKITVGESKELAALWDTTIAEYQRQAKALPAPATVAP